MKFMIASDLHGSYARGMKLFEHFDAEQPEKLILLGDYLYHGPRNGLPGEYDPAKLAELLNARKENIIAVRGNCDSEVDQMVLEFPIEGDYTQMYVDGRLWFITHGHIYDEHTQGFYPAGTVVMHGHTHLKILDDMGDRFYVNPGSTTFPKDDDQGSYMIYEDGTFTIKNIEDGSVLKTLTL